MKALKYSEHSNAGNYTYTIQPKVNKKPKKQGCFIATTVYGDYYAPQVLILRNFRDNKLRSSFIGRVFIAVYYSISPYLAETIGRSNVLTWLSRKLFDSLIKKLF